jgi:predicted DsbA family dithiol-disulfide isomerase/uncharacterized membrane protein
MTRARSLVASALALAGLAVSAALLADSLRAAPTFCAEDGCAEVRATAWAHPLGIPMPLIGLTFFLVALALAAAGPRAHRARRAVALAGAAGALGLLAVQGLVIGAWCRLCIVTDVAALLHAAAVVTARPWPRAGGGRLAGTVVAALAAVVVPLASMRASAPPVAAVEPDTVARAQPDGTAVVVDFIDFECPFCRVLHGRLREALAIAGVPVRVDRRMVPLRQHRGAMPAAIAWCCADVQGKGDEMADRLFAATDLAPAALEAIAAELHLDLARFRADAADPATRARVQRDAAAAHAAGVRSLPTLTIGRQRFVGAAATTADLVAALRRAASS